MGCCDGEPTEPGQALLERLTGAVNRHDLAALENCFAAGYLNETRPPGPGVRRAGPGAAQLGADLRLRPRHHRAGAAILLRRRGGVVGVGDGRHRRDGTGHQMAGVILFGVRDGSFSWARFYLETVRAGGASVDEAVRQHIHAGAGPAPGSRP